MIKARPCISGFSCVLLFAGMWMLSCIDANIASAPFIETE